MLTRNSCTMLMLAAMTVVSANTAVSGQETGSPRNRKPTVTVRRDQPQTGQTTPGGVRVPPPRRQPSNGTADSRGIRLPGTIFSPTQPKRRPAPVRINPHDHRNPTMSFAEASELFSRHKEWMIGANKSGWVFASSFQTKTRHEYNLKGLVNRKFLNYQVPSFHSGVNIGWTKDASAETARTRSMWAFYKESGSNSAIRYGEPLAIRMYWFETAFIKYGERKYGVDLKRVGPASYEWAILGGKPGELVRGGEDRIILYNLKYQQPLIYFNRDRGGDIGWPTSRRSGIGNIHDSPQQTAKMRAAAQALLMPGVVVGK